MEPRIIDYQPGEYARLEASVLAALATGEPVEVGLDRLDALDNEALRGLITLLRRSRAVGGEVALRANKPQIRSTLTLTALDRLFHINGVAVAEAAA